MSALEWRKSRDVAPRPLEREAVARRYSDVRRELREARGLIKSAEWHARTGKARLALSYLEMATWAFMSAQRLRAHARQGRREMWGADALDTRDLLA